MSKDIAIVGIGETPAVRRSDTNLRGMVIEAVLAALDDAGISPGEVDGIVTDATVMPTTVPHDYVAAQLGIESRFDAAMSYAGAGIVAGPDLAAYAIKSGRASVVISYFGVDWGSRPEGPYGFHDIYPAKMAFEKPYGFNAQPSYFAIWARRYLHEFGGSEEDMGRLAVQQRGNARLTGRGQNMKPMTLDDYMAAPMISDPLRIPDCCLISDGAGAYVMTSADRARDCRKQPIFVRGTGFASEPISADDVFTQNRNLLSLPGVSSAREAAEREAGIKLSETDLGQVYDCFTISTMLQIEDLGLCAKGEAGDFIADGHTALDGAIPINTHGGLLSYSYRLGIEHVVETVRQLRHEARGNQVKDVETGFVGGLSIPDYGVLVLGR